MDGLIVYGSKYGTTRRYAEELSRLTGLPAIPCGEFHRLAEGRYNAPYNIKKMRHPPLFAENTAIFNG